jgi:hypothetical protein
MRRHLNQIELKTARSATTNDKADNDDAAVAGEPREVAGEPREVAGEPPKAPGERPKVAGPEVETIPAWARAAIRRVWAPDPKGSHKGSAADHRGPAAFRA